ncbi:MAG TPA: hypothetical protein VFX16_00970 [Pseudonocardiaceae bacterium]|nr:hypothetical protein [Pseudonocardiaceae bacterium]
MTHALPDPHADTPSSPELAEARDVVRKMEAKQAGEHGVDTPAYWRAMSDRLQDHLIVSRFAPVDGRYADQAAERAYGWLLRCAAAYRALAATSGRS